MWPNLLQQVLKIGSHFVELLQLEYDLDVKQTHLCLDAALGVAKFITIITWNGSHLSCLNMTYMFNKHLLRSSFKCDQIYNYHYYKLGHTLLSCLSMTQILQPHLCLAVALGVTKFITIITWIESHFVELLKHDSDVATPSLLSCSFRCDQIYNYHYLILGHTLLSCKPTSA